MSYKSDKEILEEFDERFILPALKVWRYSNNSEQIKSFLLKVRSADRLALIEEVKEKEKEYSIIGEKADTYFMKGVEKEGYTLDQAKHDADVYCHKAEALSDILSSLQSLSN